MKTTFKIPAANLSRLQARIDDISKRAAKVAKKGALTDYTPIGLIVGDKVVVPRKDEITLLPLPPIVYFMVEVTGMAPKLAGWTFVATLQHEEGGTILRTVPTVDLAEGLLKPFRNADPACDHCRFKRRRNDTFVVRHDDGTLRQVGRNCLADFTGCKSPQALASMAEWLATAAGVAEEFEGGGGGNGEPVEEIGAYLSYVALAIREGGWLSRGKAREQGEFGPPATANVAWSLMHPGPNQKRTFPTEADVKLATDALAWADNHLSEAAPDALSDYEHNLKVAVAGGISTFRLAGIIASLISYYERAIGKELLKAQANTAGHVGTVGKRETFALTLAQVFSYDSDYGTVHIHKFVTDAGAIVVWKTTSNKLAPGRYSVKGTVKKHGDFKGEVQTELSRCTCMKVEEKAS